jgi:hypothetical protein
MPYKDRTTGLIIFGILTGLLGGLAGLMGVFTLIAGFTQSLVPAPQRMDAGQLVPAVAMYGIVAVMLIALGIGSAMTKRWARALLLIFSWYWLVIGVIEVVTMAIVLPMTLSHLSDFAPPGQPAPPQPSPAIIGVIMVFTFAFLAFFFILLPGIWTFFYMSPHVKATVEARDPRPSWTDACPLPVLALSLWAWFCLPWMALVPLSGHFALPLFGYIITGLPSILGALFFASIFAFAGWLLYHVDIRGWWIMMIFLILGSISAIVTFSVHDMMDLYRAMNYPQAQIDQIQKLGLFSGHDFVWLIVLSMLPLFGYLLWTRRYFRR